MGARAGCVVNLGPVLRVVEAQHGVETRRGGADAPMITRATPRMWAARGEEPVLCVERRKIS